MTIDAHTFQLAGKYSGWVRSLGGEWEDLIGMIRVECQPTEEQSIITIKSIEFGSWQGILAKNEKSFRADTGQGNNFFLCSIHTEKQSYQIRTVLNGAICAAPSDKLLDIRLLGDWRSSTN